MLGSMAAQGAFAADIDLPAQPLDEVVVTATRQSATVNKVPLSITAVTQRDLEQQSDKTIQDLARAVPGLQITNSNNPNGANIAIRGVYSNVGAATTAVYLDDIPLQRRTTLGQFSGSGDIFPTLYDLERIEVLRGPQGSLYGGSAEGGAIRFITPTPSLTTYSASARAETSGTQDGGLNYEFGGAIGGPLIQDKLGFRLSAYDREDSGYIDHVSLFTGNAYANNTNGESNTAYRLELLWRPTENLTITPSVYTTRDHHQDSDTYWQNVAATTVPAASYNAQGQVYNGSNGPINYTLPAHTYGPYNGLGAYKTGTGCNIGEAYAASIAPCYAGSPRTSGLTTFAISADYKLSGVTAHFTSGYVVDTNKGQNDGSFNELSGYQGGVGFLYNMPIFNGLSVYKNHRTGLTEELRLSSSESTRLTWVAGAFYSYQHTYSESHDYTSDAAAAPYLRGVPDYLVYGAPVAANGDVSARYQWLKEKEIAGFGEVNFFILPNFKLIAGGRYSVNSLSYNTVLSGAFFGYAVPTLANGGLSSGVQNQNSFLPKFGLQYDLSSSANVYFTAAEGFRMGGVNTGSYQSKCSSTFTALGLSGTPLTYGSDSLWSYELGTKFRAFQDHAQVNASLFYIDWSNVQVNYTLPSPCGFSYTTNAGHAISQGADVQTQVKIFGGLSGTFSASYTDAYYANALVGPAPTHSIFINKGDRMPVPGWQADLGLRYDFSAALHNGYVRADYQYTGAYKRGFGPGSSSYDADTYNAAETRYVTARAGFFLNTVELSVFAENLFNSQDILSQSGGRACSNAACTTWRSNNPIFVDSTFRPRTVGITVSYKQ